jgi:hypothetical protein
LAAGGRLAAARRPGSGGSSRPTPRTAEPPQRSSGSVLPTGHVLSRDAGRAAPARGGHRRPYDLVSVPWCPWPKFVTVGQVSPDRPQRGGTVVDGGERFRRSIGQGQCSEDQGERQALPATENTPSQAVECSPGRGCPRRPIRPPVGSADPQRRCSKGLGWAREELNLRPLPCQLSSRRANSVIMRRRHSESLGG